MFHKDINGLHNQLISDGCVLIGFHGTSQSAAQSMIENGIDKTLLGKRVGAQNGAGFYVFLRRARAQDFTQGYDPASEKEIARHLNEQKLTLDQLKATKSQSIRRADLQTNELRNQLRSLQIDPDGNDSFSQEILDVLDTKLTLCQPGILRVYLKNSKLVNLSSYSIDNQPLDNALEAVEIIVPLNDCDHLKLMHSPNGDQLQPVQAVEDTILSQFVHSHHTTHPSF